MATTYTDTAHQVFAAQARTDSAGAAVDDVNGEDLRTILELFTAGVIGANSYKVQQRGAGANMSVDVGSGVADTDKAILDGINPGQGNYLTRMETGTLNVVVPAAHASLARIDEVYLVMLDNAYDGTARVLPRIAYRDGTPAGSPVAPGPDAAWDAFLKLATISVPASDTTIGTAQITDNRVVAGSGMVSGGIQMGGDSDSASAGITTSFVTKAVAEFVPPADWGTYHIIAWGSASGQSTTGTNWGLAAQLDIEGSAGAQNIGTTGVSQTHVSVGATHERTGISGAVTVAMQVRETADGIQYQESTVSYIARRLS